jgi:uncharacterized protein YutE (UPF0331/DUF86 family)
MYFVDRRQIEERLEYVDVIVAGCSELTVAWDTKTSSGLHELSLLAGLAQERLLHVAIETVTDVGSLLIDGFLLRDASSYEDIMDIMYDEKALDEPLHRMLTELVKLRKPLVQDYVCWERSGLHPLIAALPEALIQFRDNVRVFIAKELGEQIP